MATETRLYTADEFLDMPDDGKIYELHYGVIIEVAGSKNIQTVLAMWIGFLLLTFVEAHKLGGWVSGADGTYVLDRYNTRIPDVAYLTAESVARQKRGEYLRGAPDLVVEVISESNTPAEMKQRVGAYLNAGARLIWLVYPETLSIEVYQPQQDTLFLKVGDTLDGAEILPGLKLPLQEVFRVLNQ